MVLDKVKYGLGWILATLLPQKAEAVRNGFTIPQDWDSSRSSPITDRLIRFYIGAQAKATEQNSPGQLEKIHQNFWSQTATYFTDMGDRTENIYIPLYKDIVQRNTPFLVDHKIQTVCEFGTGDGQWLNYLSQQWGMVQRFIGIDLSANQVAINQQRYPHLEFVTSDLVSWTAANAAPNRLYHTNSGVLEYLSEDSVKHLLSILKDRAKNSILFLIEPIYGDYDIHRETTSKIIGYEHSYTHNYVHLLEAANIKVISHEEREAVGCRMLIVLAYIA
jgi:Methyltransferase domain